jgi:hypothetical protein
MRERADLLRLAALRRFQPASKLCAFGGSSGGLFTI